MHALAMHMDLFNEMAVHTTGSEEIKWCNHEAPPTCNQLLGKAVTLTSIRKRLCIETLEERGYHQHAKHGQTYSECKQAGHNNYKSVQYWNSI